MLSNSLSTIAGRWYHLGATFNNTTKAWQLRVWDDTAGSGVLDASGTAPNNIAITSAGVAIGASLKNGTPERYFDGLIDEVVVFSDILTTGEIDQIRLGAYAGSTPTTTTTTLPGGTTTTTLPPAGNDFSVDGNAKALWSVDNGALTTDSKGTNTLTDNNTVGTSTGDYQVGTASADFEYNNSESLTITDANLASGFPLKSGESNDDISVTFWFKKESNNSYAALFSKWDTGTSARSLLLRDNNGTLEFFIGTSGGAGFELLDNSLSTIAGRWYHLGATFNNTTKAWQLRVWDDTAGSGVLDASGTAPNNIAITSAGVAIGASLKNGTPERYFDGLIDEVVVFSDILTTGEIDQIRLGTYAGSTPTTTTTLPGGTTTTTLPPAGNDFSVDGNAKALWSVDNGALTTDSKGTNTLTDNNTVGTSTGDYQVGNASADFEYNNSESLTITDANLASGFPLKSGESNDDISVTFWFKKESNNSYAALFSKWDTGTSARSLLLRDNNGTLEFFIGTSGGAGFELLDNSLSTIAGRWYHLGATFNNTTKAWQLRVWDDTAGSGVLDASGTAPNNIAITSAGVAIGASLKNGTPERYFDGLIDEVVVFSDILTTGEIDQIRQGTYAGSTPTTTTTTLPGGTTTTTTTLPPAGNDFSGDGNVAAQWPLDNGPLTFDASENGNTLTDNNTVTIDYINKQIGDASAHFEPANRESLTITNDALSSGFPLKWGENNGDISVTFWYKKETNIFYGGLFSKWDAGANARSLLLRDNNGTLEFFIGTSGGAGFELLNNSLSTLTGRWYHVGVTFNNTTKAWELRVWDDTAGSVVLNASGTAANNIAITNASVAIGASYKNGTPERFTHSSIDEVIVFNDILTTVEIDQIRSKTYSGPVPTTTTTTLPPTTTTTTTTLPPPTTTTTLPPLLGTNDFSTDGNAVALWSVDNGSLTIDYSGNGNTLTDNNTVGSDTVDYQVGNASADFAMSNSESLTITDAALSSGFPLKNLESNDDISVTFWFKLKSLNNYAALFSKWDSGTSARSLLLRDNNGRLEFFIGTNSGASFETLDGSLSTFTGRWYHLGATFNNTTKAWKLRVWDDTLGSVVLNASGTATNNISIVNAPVSIGASYKNGTPERFSDSRMDEIVVFSDILSTGEIDQIRQGTYSDSNPMDVDSHQAHQTAAFGPQITCGTSCHTDTGMTPGGNFLDSQDLANTTVCDKCHSPGGAYNGVDSTSGSVGAKDNWVSGVYDTVSGGFLQGKEKWCVGCHDDVPAYSKDVIDDAACVADPNCVFAPNMAGDDIDYGYYKTGHGKHSYGQGITCLTCHDPAFMHVDGEARTYRAADDNYQDGYRLKYVDGEAPLDVPRSDNISVGQFRLCFTCHDSTPYLNFDNTDTNFRADVNDSCYPLNENIADNKVNKHNYHLFTTQVWDSDWDLATTDSAPSCTACHNVHGPRLSGGASHAPAMIRTGELIGRLNEGALNLEYFISPCPNKTPSPTNELFDYTGDSTGGAFMNDPLQLENPTRGGVCGMCHATQEPYWRVAKDIVGCTNCHTSVPHFVEEGPSDLS